jgi:hypothetical protein
VSAELVDSALEADVDDVDQPESTVEAIVEAAADPVPESIQPVAYPTMDVTGLEASVDPPRASSPWTPSYSVSVQGVSDELMDSRLEGDVVDKVEQPEPAAEQILEVAVPDSIPMVDVSAVEAAVDPPRASSPWTASYSVSVQGSPLPVSAELVDSALEADVDDVHQPEPTAEAIVEVAADPVPESIQPAAYPTVDVSGLEASADSPRASSPWTPSYSVQVQGSPHPVSAELVDSGLEAHGLVDEVQEPESAVEKLVEAAVPDSTQQPTVDVSGLEASVDPPRPWTPSYSVSVQGSPLPVSKELMDSGLEADAVADKVEQPESAAEEVVEAAVPDPTPMVDVSVLEAAVDPPRAGSPWTPSYSVSVQGSPLPVSKELTDSGFEADAGIGKVQQPAEPIVEAAADPVPDSIPAAPPTVDVSALEAPLDPPRPSSPWTPSYSVSVQGNLPISNELVSGPEVNDVIEVQQPESAHDLEALVDGSIQFAVQPTVEVSSLEAPVDLTSWTPSYSVSVQGSPLPVSKELLDSGLKEEVVGEAQEEEAGADHVADEAQSEGISSETVIESTETQESTEESSSELVVEDAASGEVAAGKEAAAEPEPVVTSTAEPSSQPVADVPASEEIVAVDEVVTEPKPEPVEINTELIAESVSTAEDVDSTPASAPSSNDVAEETKAVAPELATSVEDIKKEMSEIVADSNPTLDTPDAGKLVFNCL